MYELIQLTDTCYYIDCPSKIGLIRINDTEVCLIDSGNDKEAGRKVRQILDRHQWTLKAIYNTHSHADHIGGNKYLQGQSQCKIYMPPMNASFAKFPILEPTFLYGAHPPKELHNKFLLAQESHVEELCPEVLPSGLTSIDLWGHCLDMVGYKTEDNVFFLADSLLSQDILEKYQIGVMYNVEHYLATLEKLQSVEAAWFVPAHADACTDITSLAQYNIGKVFEVADKICTLCSASLSFEALLQKLFTDYALHMNFNQYVLVGTSVRALLSWLQAQEKVEAYFKDNTLYWKSITA